MITTGSKLLIGATVMAIVAAIVYGTTSEGALGTIGLSSAAIALGLLAGVNVAIRDSNVSAMDTAALTESPAARRAPGASMWPVVAALGGVLVVVGLVTYPVVTVFGIGALLAATAEWMVQAWSERASADAAYNDEVRGLLANPLEFPILGAIGLGIIVYSFSRIMLFLSKTGGVAAFALLAALLLFIGFVIAYRPTLRGGAIAIVAGLATFGLVAGGVAAAIGGERELHPHPTTGDLAGQADCDTADETEADENASRSVAAKSSVAAELTLGDDGVLVARVPGVDADLSTLELPRSNPSNLIFRNESAEERRLVIDLGTRNETDATGETIPDTEVADQQCTALVDEGGSQLLTVTIGQPSVTSETGYRLFVPGVESAEVGLVVP
jgi:hypothetical protein